MPSSVRWSLSIALLILFLGFASMNWVLAFRMQFRKESHSFGGFLGGLAGMFAILLAPLPAIHKYWCVPLFADIGAGPLLIVTAAWHIRRAVNRHKQQREPPNSAPHRTPGTAPDSREVAESEDTRDSV